MRKREFPPPPVLALSLIGLALALANAFAGPTIRDAGARLIVIALFVLGALAFGYCTANLIRSAASLASRGGRRP
jgi:uncharacterized YccA/Bax inhibitor family protein